jgi:hypothetical protein
MRCEVINAALQRLAADQHGIVTRAQLLNAGVAPNTIDHWGNPLLHAHLDRALPTGRHVKASATDDAAAP